MNLEKEIFDISLQDIIPNRFQPREMFDDDALQELSKSIKEHGVIQPIIVRKVGDKFEIIAGERRYRASQLAGKPSIPALVRDIDDKEAAKIALLENLQRTNLTAIEEAKTYQTILKLDNITQEELAQNLGKSQSTIANKLRLLTLNEEVQTALLNNQISERHARSLLGLDNNKQNELLNRIINEKLTVRQLDEEIMKATGRMPEAASAPQEEPQVINANGIISPVQSTPDSSVPINVDIPSNINKPIIENKISAPISEPVVTDTPANPAPITVPEVEAPTNEDQPEPQNYMPANDVVAETPIVSPTAPELENQVTTPEAEPSNNNIVPNPETEASTQINPAPIAVPEVEAPINDVTKETPITTPTVPEVEQQETQETPSAATPEVSEPAPNNIFAKLREQPQETPEINPNINTPEVPEPSSPVVAPAEIIAQAVPSQETQEDPTNEPQYEDIYDLRFAINNFRQAIQNTEKFGFKVTANEYDTPDKYQIVIDIEKKN